MAQPPYPPQAGSEPGGFGGWSRQPDGADQPTEQLVQPGEPGRQQTQPFGQPQFGQASGQQPYGSPSYGPQPYGSPPYGPPQYGRQAGQPPYVPPQYGQPYGPPPYGPPPYGPPGAPPPKSSRNTLIALIIVGAVVLAAIGVALFLVLDGTARTTASGLTATATDRATSGPASSASASANGASGIPPAGDPPDGLGGDPVLDQYAQSCYAGDMTACDTLYNDSQVGSKYETYGGTCAGRQPISNSDLVYCTDAFPG
jgi:hypothetical protein